MTRETKSRHLSSSSSGGTNVGGPDDGDAILQLIAAVAELRDATHTYASQTTATFQRMEAVLETMLDVAGETKARLDDHEARLTDLERGKK